jgi:hypothetical protein
MPCGKKSDKATDFIMGGFEVVPAAIAAEIQLTKLRIVTGRPNDQ